MYGAPLARTGCREPSLRRWLISALTDNAFSNSRARLLISQAQHSGLTLRQLAARFAAGRGHLLVVGTGHDVADTMRRWVEAGAADGFNVMPTMLPGGPRAFGVHVTPHLAIRRSADAS